MVWKATDPQGNEAAKVKFDVIPFVGASGMDLGCGPEKLFEHFLGIDSGIDTKLFGIQMKPDIVVPDCARMRMFADGCVETVFSSHTLEHIEDYRAALAEWWRLVAVGGHLILYLPHRDLYPRIGTPGANPDHKHDFAPEDIVTAMHELAKGWDLLVNETRDGGREYSFLQVYRKVAPEKARGIGALLERPAKSVGIVRPGAYGDSLWGSSVAAAYKAQGYHVTVYTGPAGAEVLQHDPNIDRLIHLRGHWFSDDDWILYYLWESKKHAKFVNLIGSVETALLPHPNEMAYYWPLHVRQKRMGANYLEAMHEVADIEYVPRQRFYPTAEERAWARTQRQKLFPGPLVVVAPAGSGAPKTWPHVQRFMDLMAARGVHTVVLGEIRQELVPDEKWSCVLGKDLPIRLAMTLALEADVVVGTESAIVNAVAMEPMLKVVLLSHSSAANLTRDWVNTMSVEPQGLACFPCHRLHRGFEFCAQDERTGFSRCQSMATAESIADAIAPWLRSVTAREAA
jgi:ADP-heptose:LPS heptosyltransferase